jgi:hypothetical protein
VVPAIGIVPISLHPFRWNGKVIYVTLAFCVNVAINEFDLSRVAVASLQQLAKGLSGKCHFE